MNNSRRKFLISTTAGLSVPWVLCLKKGIAGETASEFISPVPRQLAWQQREFTAFAHFTVNTFTDKEWGDGTESPAQFNPTAFDAGQWVETCKNAGMKMIILTAKHHDGFCLWPGKYTEHSVKNSPFVKGKGDIVKAVSDACSAGGLKFGIYLSPWDRHESSYGTSAYNQYYLNQLNELLTSYGEISEVWFDGAKGENAKDMEYDFNAYRSLVRKLQPSAVMFSDEGPDVRWIGNERGIAGETCWSTMDRSKVSIGHADTNYLNAGDPEGHDWVPGECDVSIRPGWFYHSSEDEKVKTVQQLIEIYYNSVGRNCVLLLNVPLDRRGLMYETDAARLREFRSVIDETFKSNLLEGKSFNAASGSITPKTATYRPGIVWSPDIASKEEWIEFDLKKPVTFDRAMIQEQIEHGQRVNSFAIDIWDGSSWQRITKATTIGYKRLLRFPPVQSQKVRFTIIDSRATPRISAMGIYKASPGEKNT